MLIKIEKGKSPPICRAVQARHPGDIFKLGSPVIEKDAITLIPAERMTSDDRLAIHFFTRIEYAGHIGVLTDIDSFFRKAFVQVCVRAHDRAP